MDFQAMLRPVTFGKPSPAREGSRDVPRPLLRAKDRSRKLAQLAEAAQILEVLPAEGETLFAIQSGRYDLADALEVLIDRLGTVADMKIATLSFNSANVETIRGWVDTGTVRRLAVYCSTFFFAHNETTYADLLDIFQAAGPAYRLSHGRNHAKIVCMAFESGPRLTLTGSSNMRSNSNKEAFVLCHDAEVHRWHADWIAGEMSLAQGNES